MERSKGKRIVLLVMIFVLSLILLFAGCNSNVNIENYQKIKNGMSFEEVVEILGDDYEISSDSGYGGYTASVYVWGDDEECIVVIFMNGSVYSKSQSGL